MGEINLSSACLVSYPEIVLLIIASLLIVGRKDILDIRNKTNLFKLFISSVAMTIVTVVLKNLVGQQATIISLGIFIVIYVFVLGVHWTEAAGGILIASVAFMALEYVSLLISFAVTGGSFSIMNTDRTLIILSGLVPRILDAILVVVLYKLPVTIVDLGSIKDFTKSALKDITSIYIFLALFIFGILKIAKLDYNYTTLWGVLSAIINVIIMICIVSGVLFVVTRLMRLITEERRGKAAAYFKYQRLRKVLGDDIIAIDKEMDIALNKAVEDLHSKNIWGGKKREKK